MCVGSGGTTKNLSDKTPEDVEYFFFPPLVRGNFNSHAEGGCSSLPPSWLWVTWCLPPPHCSFMAVATCHPVVPKKALLPQGSSAAASPICHNPLPWHSRHLPDFPGLGSMLGPWGAVLCLFVLIKHACVCCYKYTGWTTVWGRWPTWL